MVCGTRTERGHFSSRRRAFTLLEVLLSIAIIALLVVTGLAFYSNASDVRSRVFSEVDAINGRRLVMERMTADLRAAIQSTQGQERLEGAADYLSLDAAQVLDRSAWNRVDNINHPPPAHADLRRLSYQLRISVDEEGNTLVEGLERSCDRMPTRQVFDENVKGEVVLLSPRVKFMRLRYWDGNAWADQWGGNELPMAVEINLGMDPLPEGVDPAEYPFESFRRVVHVPASRIRTGGLKLGNLTGGTP